VFNVTNRSLCDRLSEVHRFRELRIDASVTQLLITQVHSWLTKPNFFIVSTFILPLIRSLPQTVSHFNSICKIDYPYYKMYNSTGKNIQLYIALTVISICRRFLVQLVQPFHTSITPYVGVSTVIIARSSMTMQILKFELVNMFNSSIFASIHFMLVAAESRDTR